MEQSKIRFWSITVLLVTLTALIACSKDEAPEIKKSSAKRILSFVLRTQDNQELPTDIVGTINEQQKTITATLPENTLLSSLLPQIVISEKADINPKGPQDFTKSVYYTIIAEDNTKSNYAARLLSEEGEANEPPGDFEVEVDTTGLNPIVQWTESVDPNGDSITYAVELENTVVQEGLQEREFQLLGLEYESTYRGRIIATNEQGATSESDFVFTMREIRQAWIVTLGGSKRDYLTDIISLADGGSLTVGATWSLDGDIVENQGLSDVWVIKLNAEGIVEWQTTIGGSGEDVAVDVAETLSGGYVIAGRTSSTDGDVSVNKGGHDFWVVKLEAGGSVLWEKTYGGSEEDYAYTVIPTSDGGYFVGGDTRSDNGDVTDFNGVLDFWLLRLDPQGNLLWEQTYGGSSSDQFRDMEYTEDGGLILVGSTFSPDGDFQNLTRLNDFLGLKVTEDGTLLWAQNFGGNNSDFSSIIGATSDGNFIIGGSTRSFDGDVSQNLGMADIWIVQVDGQGFLRWESGLGGSQNDVAKAILALEDGSTLVGGDSNSSDGSLHSNYGETDIVISKLDASGDLFWVNNYGGSASDVLNHMDLCINGGFMIVGESWSSDGDLTGNKGKSDAVILKLH